MSTALLHTQSPDQTEAHELREEIERLQSATESMTHALGEATRARGVAEARRQATDNELAVHKAMLEEAHDLRAALEHRLVEVERELGRERAISAIRAKLLADITEASWWRRKPAIQRAVRVEWLLGSARAASRRPDPVAPQVVQVERA